jgi:hypothetical protein
MNLAALPDLDQTLDNVLNRHDIELDMEVWGAFLGE